MTLDQLINVLVTVTLVEMMIAVGMGVSFIEIVAVARNGRMVLKAAVANYLGVPAVTMGLLWLLDASPPVAAGFLILAACPGAPFGPPLTGLAKGNVPVAAGLMVLLAGSSAIVAPIMLSVLLPLTGFGDAATVAPGRIIANLTLTQLLPLAAGMMLRQWRPALADRLRPGADQLSKLLNLAAIGLILSVQFPLLAAIRPAGLAGMLALLVASWTAGWILGGPLDDGRRAMALTTSLRNVGICLVIATGSFAGTPAVTSVVVYGLLEVAGSLLLAVYWSRRPVPSVAGKGTG